MPKKKKTQEPGKELSPYEKAGMIEILSTEETEDYVITTIRTYGGATVINRVPRRSKEEDLKILEAACIPMARIANPGQNITEATRIRVLMK